LPHLSSTFLPASDPSASNPRLFGIFVRSALYQGAHTGRGGLGSIFVWASGNGGTASDNCNADGYANSIYTLAVSAVDENGRVPYYVEPCAPALVRSPLCAPLRCLPVSHPKRPFLAQVVVFLILDLFSHCP
jgi:hypothetical protein